MIKARKLEFSSLSLTDVVVFALSAGVIATLLTGYVFGEGNPVSKLPIVMRAMDDSFLINDFYVNVNTEFGPRYYYAHLLAFLAGFIPLPSVYFSLTLLSNTLVALVTALIARDLFNGSNLAGFLAAAIVMSVSTFSLGSGTTIYTNELHPVRLVLPFLLLSLWAGIKGRPILAALLAGIASLIHPVLGPETGAIALATIAIVYLLAEHKNPTPENRKVDLAKILIAFLILAAFLAASVVPYLNRGGSETQQLVYVKAYLRSPHHHLPSTFGIRDYLDTLLFLIATGIAWYWWQKKPTIPRRVALSVPILVGIVALLCVGGYLFVEVIPWPLWVIGQPFRLPFLVKWLGLVMVAGTIAELILNKGNNHSQIESSLLLLGVLTPITMGFTHTSKFIRDRTQQYFPPWSLNGGLVLTVVVSSVYLFFVSQLGNRTILLFSLLVFMALSYIYFFNRWFSRLFIAGFTMALLVMLLTDGILPARVEAILGRFKPAIVLADLNGDEIDMASYARKHTPEDAVFLTPPQFGKFRFTAERAIVVDFKAFPFQDQAMLEWQRRLFDSYGIPNSNGFEAEAELDDNYRRIEDQTMYALQSKYNVSYAVLYQETETSLPVIYENQTYKLVKLDVELMTQVD